MPYLFIIGHSVLEYGLLDEVLLSFQHIITLCCCLLVCWILKVLVL